jgi:hypothetical protein
MATSVTMNFSRDDASGQGCLEYSWVPEGKRRVIILPPGTASGSQKDAISSTLNPSHVEVYRLDNNGSASTEKWQFPPGPPHTSPIDEATIVVSSAAMTADGTVVYTDGKTNGDKRILDAQGRPCPEIPPRR